MAGGLRLVRGRGRRVRVFGEEVEPVLQIVLTVARHLGPLTLATCATTTPEAET